MQAIDTTERDRALLALEQEKEHHRRLQLEYQYVFFLNIFFYFSHINFFK